jgi:PAS domain S-box-containing protein
MAKKSVTEDSSGTPRARVTYVYALLAFASLSIFGALHIIAEGNALLGSLEIAGACATALAAAGLRLTHNVALTYSLVLLSILALLIVMIFSGGTAGTGIFWVFMFPVSAFFLTNRKTGLYWMFALFAIVGLIMLATYMEWVTIPYSFVTLRQLLITLIVVTIGIYVYEQARETIENKAKKSDTATKEEKIKADIIIDNIGEGVIVVDPEGRIMLASRVAAEMLGWDVSELKDQIFIEAVPMVDTRGNKVAANKRPIMHTLQNIADVHSSATYLRKDGTAFPAEITSKAIMVDGTLHGAIATFRDTTAERAIDRAKSEFVTLASHQLRTPISAIAWVGELLLHGDAGKLKPEQIDYIQQIYHSNKRMAALVDAMLTASSLELDNLPVRPEKLNLVTLSREVLAEWADKLPANKILHVKEHYDPDLTEVLFDPAIVKIILQNLIANAFKYTPSDGSVTITIKKVSEDIVIEVSDTGVGIPIKQQSKIFTRLFRAENVKHQDTDGTGLGLYIVKAASEYVGGHIMFTSAENKGTTFTVTLPLSGMQAKAGKG